MIRLTVTSPDGAQRELAFDGREITVGGAPTHDVVLAGAPPNAFRVYHRDDERCIAPLEYPVTSKRDGKELFESTLHPREVFEIAGHRIVFAPPALTRERRAQLVPVAVLDAIALRFGRDAAAGFVDDLWSLWGDGGPRLHIDLFVEGPFAAVQIPNDGTPLSIPYFFWVGGRWVYLTGLDAFRQAIAEARPDLSQWEPIARIYQRFTHAEILRTREDAIDYSDPRWHLMPWTSEQVDQWEPPRFDGRALRFCVEHRRALECVTVWQDTFAVDVSRR